MRCSADARCPRPNQNSYGWGHEAKEMRSDSERGCHAIKRGKSMREAVHARAQSLDLRALVAASRYDFLVHSCASAACGACSGALESRHRLPDHSLARAAQTRRIRRSSRAHCERPCEMQAQPSKPHCRSQVCARCRKKKIACAAVLAAPLPARARDHQGTVRASCSGRAGAPSSCPRAVRCEDSGRAPLGRRCRGRGAARRVRLG